MHQTRTGRYLYATGGNPLHARQSGLAYNRLTILSYALAGLFAALAGIILAARSFSGDPVIGDTYNMDSVAAAVVGGISLTGGIGSVVGAFAGSYILAMINNTLNMLNVFAYYQYIIKGLILVLALLVFQLKRRKKYED
jgi:ribose transport system permease protein